MNNPKILGVLQNLELANRNVSSTLGFLANHLKPRGLVSDIIDCDLDPLWKKLYLVKNYHRNEKIWSLKSALDTSIRKQRSRKALKLIARNRADYNLILQIGTEFSTVEAARSKGVPVFSYHDDNVYRYFKSRTRNLPDSTQSRFKPSFQKVFEYERDIYSKLDGILCMTEYLRRVFIEKFKLPENKVHCIGYGANLDLPGVDLDEKDYDTKTLLFIAKDSFEEKGGYILLEAFKTVRKECKNTELVIIGKKQDIDLPGVKWTGYLDKNNREDSVAFANHLRQASLFVLPCFVEAAGSAFLEAMSYGIPCIGANQGSTPEMITGRDAGLVLDQPNPDELADKIIGLLKEPEELKRMGINARQAVDSFYNWDSVCDRAETLFRKALV